MCQVELMSLNSRSVGSWKSSFLLQDGHGCTCIGSPRWKENINVPIVIFNNCVTFNCGQLNNTIDGDSKLNNFTAR